MLVCARKEKDGPSGADQGFSRAMQVQQPPCNVTQELHPPAPSFLLEQNPPSKWIVPTDNM